MSYYPTDTWTCRFCGRMDNHGDECPSCGATRSQTVNAAPPQENLAIPVVTPAPAPTRSPILRFVLGCMLVLLVPFALAGICVSAVTVSEWRDYQALSQSGVTAKATVVNRYTTDSSDTDTFHVSYRFTVNDEVYDGDDTVGASAYDAAEHGSPITIRYAQSDPKISHIGTSDSNDLAIVLTVFSVCWDGFLLIGIAIAIRSVFRSRRSS